MCHLQVHSGFLKSYLSLRDSALVAIKTAQVRCAACRIHVTGHSLGGAQAVLCAADLTLQGIKVDHVLTYGCPRVGDPHFVEWWDKAVAPGRSIRSVRREALLKHNLNAQP